MTTEQDDTKKQKTRDNYRTVHLDEMPKQNKNK